MENFLIIKCDKSFELEKNSIALFGENYNVSADYFGDFLCVSGIKNHVFNSKKIKHINNNELFLELGLSLYKENKVTNDIADRLENFKISVNELDGMFVQLNLKNDYLKIRLNQVSLYSVFYYYKDGVLLISTHFTLIKDMLQQMGVELEINEKQHAMRIAEERYVSALYGTEYKDVYMLSGCEDLIYENGELKTFKYNKLQDEYLENLHETDIEEFWDYVVNRYVHILKSYFSLAEFESVKMDLTGGKDSRTIFGILKSFIPLEKFEVNTYGNDNDVDVIVSNAIVKKYRLKKVNKPSLIGVRINKNVKFSYLDTFDINGGQSCIYNGVQCIDTLKNKHNGIVSINGLQGNLILPNIIDSSDKFKQRIINQDYLKSEVVEMLDQDIIALKKEYSNYIKMNRVNYCYDINMNKHNSGAYHNMKESSALIQSFGYDLIAKVSYLINDNELQNSDFFYNVLKRVSPDMIVEFGIEECKNFTNSVEQYTIRKTDMYAVSKMQGAQFLYFKKNLNSIIRNIQSVVKEDSILEINNLSKLLEIEYTMIVHKKVTSIFYYLFRKYKLDLDSLLIDLIDDDFEVKTKENSVFDEILYNNQKYMYGVNDLYEVGEKLKGICTSDSDIKVVLENITEKIVMNLNVSNKNNKYYYECTLQKPGNYRLMIRSMKNENIYMLSNIRVVDEIGGFFDKEIEFTQDEVGTKFNIEFAREMFSTYYICSTKGFVLYKNGAYKLQKSVQINNDELSSEIKELDSYLVRVFSKTDMKDEPKISDFLVCSNVIK